MRTELSRSQVVYEEGKRPYDMICLRRPGARYADNVTASWYFLAANRLPWLGLEPYATFEWFRWPTGLGEGFLTPSVGMDVHFNAHAQLKLQYMYNYFFSDIWDFERQKNRDKSVLMARVVLGF